MACVVFRLMPAWLCDTFWLSLFSPDASVAIRLVCRVFCLTPVWLYGLLVVCFAWCLQGYMTFVDLFVPKASEAIRLAVFCFAWRPCWLYGLCCFVIFSPDASLALWLVLFYCLFAWRLRGYMACVVLSSFRLTPPWLYGLCCFVICLA